MADRNTKTALLARKRKARGLLDVDPWEKPESVSAGEPKEKKEDRERKEKDRERKKKDELTPEQKRRRRKKREKEAGGGKQSREKKVDRPKSREKPKPDFSKPKPDFSKPKKKSTVAKPRRGSRGR